MIINYPTGLYKNVLPSKPEHSQNVTFLISTTTPPRTNLLYPKIPIGIAAKRRESDGLTVLERHKRAGQLVYTVSKASRQKTGNNARQFEIGEILNFEKSSVKSINPMLVREDLELQHNLNTFDYDELGLTSSEVQIITDESLDTFDIISRRLNQLKVERANAEIDISTNQKIINEANRNISALVVMLENASSTGSDIEELIAKLEQRKKSAENDLTSAMSVANQAASEAQAEVDRLRSLSVVLR